PPPGAIALVATFQGCPDEVTCDQPRARSVEGALPAAGAPRAPAAATAADAGPGPGGVPPAGEAAGGATASAPADAGGAGDGAIASRDASSDNAARTRPPSGAGLPAGGAIGALVLALLGGLVLNLMPCVLPILSLKVLGLAQSGEGRQRARSHALWYTAGVLA